MFGEMGWFISEGAAIGAMLFKSSVFLARR
jgi:hypothetical protein